MTDSIQSMTDASLGQRLAEIERELVRKRFQHSMGQLENTSTLRTLRKEVARIKTEAGRREREQDLPRESLLVKNRSVAQNAAPNASEESSEGGFLKGIVDKLTGND